MCLCSAVKLDSLVIVDHLLKKGANVNQQDGGELPLCVAVQCGHVEIVKRLLSAGAKINGSDQNGRSAFDYAERMESNDPELAKKYREIYRLLINRKPHYSFHMRLFSTSSLRPAFSNHVSEASSSSSSLQ